MSDAAPFDFAPLEEHLLRGCLEAFVRYREVQDVDDPAVFFALDCNPYYGEFLPSFDTRSNALACLRAGQAELLTGRHWLTDHAPDAWRRTHEFARHQSLSLFHDEVSEFTHHMIHDLAYDVSALTRSERYAQLNEGAGVDGWIEGHVRIVLARLFDRLVEAQVVDTIAHARPFGLGYAYHGERMIVCRAVY